MKKLQTISILFMLFISSLAFIQCNDSDGNMGEEKKLSVENYGKIHNEAVLELINLNEKSKSNEDLIKTMSLLISEMNSDYFSNNSYDKIAKYFSSTATKNNKNTSFDFRLFYTEIKNDAILQGVSEELINFYDDMFNEFLSNENRTLVKSMDYYKSKLKNDKEIRSFEIFNSIYKNSKKLWTETAPKKYLLKNKSLRRGCDQDQQVILADAIAGGILSLLTGPAGALGGGAASYLVREQQIQSGGCI